MDHTVSRRLGRWVGLTFYLVTGVFYLSSGLVVPVVPWLIILNLLWVAGLVTAWRASAARWWVALLSGPLAWVFWILYVSLGANLFGWTA